MRDEFLNFRKFLRQENVALAIIGLGIASLIILLLGMLRIIELGDITDTIVGLIFGISLVLILIAAPTNSESINEKLVENVKSFSTAKTNHKYLVESSVNSNKILFFKYNSNINLASKMTKYEKAITATSMLISVLTAITIYIILGYSEAVSIFSCFFLFFLSYLILETIIRKIWGRDVLTSKIILKSNEIIFKAGSEKQTIPLSKIYKVEFETIDYIETSNNVHVDSKLITKSKVKATGILSDDFYLPVLEAHKMQLVFEKYKKEKKYNYEIISNIPL